MLDSKKISVADYFTSLIERIRNTDHKVLAWEHFDEDKFMSNAHNSDKFFHENKHKYKKTLSGIPIGIKDVFNSKDMPTEMGSSIWKGFTPGNNARVVDDIIYAGGVNMGKTVTAEFAVHEPGKTKNPHDPKHMPGTSSSGSAAAVASGMAPLALGTQTAGSTTRPASYCGIYGFKPSFGIIPRTGILKTLDTLDHVTIFSREVSDTTLLLNTIRVKGKNHPYVYKNMDCQNHDIGYSKVNVAFVKTHVWGNAHDYMKDEILSFMNKLAGLDSIVLHEVNLPSIINETHHNHDLVYSKALSYYFSDEYNRFYEKLSSSFKKMVEYGKTITKEKYQEALLHQNNAQREIDLFFNDYDIVLSMSTVGEAPLLKENNELPDAALIWTYVHTPSINIPISTGPNKLPISIQLVSKRYNDYKLLSFVKMLENKSIIPKVEVAN